jgi:hypothetical protein
VSQDPEKPGAVPASEQATEEWSSTRDRDESEARGAELREELAITDERRAEEEEAKAEQAVADAQKDESKKERKRREAEERVEVAAKEAEEARAAADARAEDARAEAGAVSGAAVASPGRGDDPKALASAARTEAGAYAAAPPDAVEGPEKPELYVAGAFAGAFLFARILKKIAE